MLLATALTLTLSLTITMTIILGLLVLCFDLICVSIAFLLTIILIFNNRVGEKKIDNAREQL